jgi:hypothetical protein
MCEELEKSLRLFVDRSLSDVRYRFDVSMPAPRASLSSRSPYSSVRAGKGPNRLPGSGASHQVTLSAASPWISAGSTRTCANSDGT